MSLVEIHWQKQLWFLSWWVILLESPNGKKIFKIRKLVIKTFKNVGFKIELKSNWKLLIFWTLETTHYYIPIPYKNHPPQIVKQLPISIKKDSWKPLQMEKHLINQKLIMKKPWKTVVSSQQNSDMKRKHKTMQKADVHNHST